MKLIVALVASASVLAFATPALAVGNPALGNAANGLQAMRELNLIVLGNLTNGSQHVQGKAFIGGDSAGVEVGSGGSGAYTHSSRAALTVGGNISNAAVQSGLGSPQSVRVGGNINNINMNVGGHIDAGGTVSGFNPSGTKTATTGVAGLKTQIQTETTTLANDLAALSLSLKQLPAIATITSKANKLDVTGAGDFAVFNMTEAAFEDGNDYDKLFAGLAGNLSIVINVFGADIDQSSNFNAGAWVNEHVLWNFVEATTIDVKGFHGSILGVNAALGNSSSIEGSVAVNNFAMRGEVHLGTFQGPGPRTPVTPVPEPATWGTMLLGFGMVGMMARSRRRRSIIAG
ncbi:collagen-binding domain-containing protein [Sphingomonas quercus]|uniref:Choice-of-anchor A family protein n=1 Tax=Sphingomonas quercus TaxID=2842451 RepID=A0ABS6BKQ6_9SPHN|nr:collagen-binding domain-containing protein [Sphingomonas quercus]MBU3078883.1 choice-of-anchor A family protein [Sphingomonas quercus]